MNTISQLFAVNCAVLVTACYADSVETVESIRTAAKAGFESSFGSIAVRRCLECHNPSDAKGGLDLTRRDTLHKGGDSGAAIAPGKPEESYLIERVREGSMPPKDHGRPLSNDETKRLAAWVAAGAKWPKGRVLSQFDFTTDRRAGRDWWSLEPVRHSDPPIVDVRENDGAIVRTPVDAFILRRLNDAGLSPAPPADRATLLRRATFDLLGLPPTPDEIDAFINDDAPDAYDRLIDRLLASPQYGERWGRHWLDVVRFGESDGYEHDKLRPHAWRYRDYVVDAFNRDKPYNDFVRAQLAGDAIEPRTHMAIAATGFLVAGPWDEVQNVAASKTERARAQEAQMEEIIAAVSQTFLGLTVNCARCHDHKFDPIPQTDYYRLKAVFAGIKHADGNKPGNRSILTPEENQLREHALAPIHARIAELTAAIDKLDDQGPADLRLSADAENALVKSPSGNALDARRSHATTKSRAAFHAPPFSVECRTRLHGKSGFNILVASSRKESARHWELYTYAGTGELSFYAPGYTPAEIKSGVDVVDGKWRRVGVTFDGKRVKLYVDGQLAKQTDVKRTREGGKINELWVGAYPPQNIGCDGLVDEVRISSSLRELEEDVGRNSDVGRNKRSAVPAEDANTLALWRFDNAENNIVRNESAAPAPSRDQKEADRRRDRLASELEAAKKQLTAHDVPLAYIGHRVDPEPTHLLLRGEIDKPAEIVKPAALSHVSHLPHDLNLSTESNEADRRLAFADWVVRRDNPLTARVMVNRIWQYHFGRGLVTTPSDFGFQAGRPTHPELLDWLAAEFVADWSVKRIHRLVMLSAAYRRSSRFDKTADRVDRDNTLLWRFAPRRLEAEAVRDAMLAVSGELNPQIGGPGFRPFTVTVRNTHFYNLFDSGKPEFNRRTIYRINIATGRDPFLDALDCPSPSLAAPQRRHTTTPLQALSLMNEPFVLRQAARMANRVRQIAGDDVERQIHQTWRLALGREPDPAELTAAIETGNRHGLKVICWAVLNSSEFLYLR